MNSAAEPEETRFGPVARAQRRSDRRVEMRGHPRDLICQFIFDGEVPRLEDGGERSGRKMPGAILFLRACFTTQRGNDQDATFSVWGSAGDDGKVRRPVRNDPKWEGSSMGHGVPEDHP